MKKLLFLLPAAALALASCSSDSVVEQNPSKGIEANALQIYPDLQGITRGTVLTNANLTDFHLKTSGDGFQTSPTKVNDNPAALDKDVSKSGSKWVIDGNEGNPYYWPSKTASNSFTAWAPKDAVAGSYTASTTIADQKDIIVAFNSGTASDLASGVPLKFRHILSKIVVKADNADKSKVQIKVKKVALRNIASTSSWALPTASTADALGYTPWGSLSEEKTYTVDLATEKTLDGTAAELTGTDPILLIPQTLGTANIGSATGQYISLLVQIVDATDATKLIYPKNNKAEYATTGVTDSEKWAWAAVDVNTEWEPGKIYTYTLHFKENGYGKIDGETNGGNKKPGEGPDGPQEGDPEPGDDVTDSPVELILDVDVVDFVDATAIEENM